MQILLADSDAKKNSIVTTELIQISDTAFVLNAEIDGTFRITRKEENVYTLDGSMTAVVTTACDRCGIPVVLNVDQSYFYQLRVEEQPQMNSEHHCSDDDYDVLYLSDSVIESTDILREQLLLALPVSSVCSESCMGLCDRCGTNLNENQCKCGEVNENSPFAILKKLQKN